MNSNSLCLTGEICDEFAIDDFFEDDRPIEKGSLHRTQEMNQIHTRVFYMGVWKIVKVETLAEDRMRRITKGGLRIIGGRA